MAGHIPRDELFKATVAAEGITTGPGEATGLSLVDIGLAGSGLNSYVSMLAVIHPGDPTSVDSRDITVFDNIAGEVTVASAFKGGQVLAGVPYKIVTFRFTPAEVAALTTIAENDQYYDRVFFDSVNGVAGTAWPVGTPQVPSNVIADVITICGARNLRTISAHGALTLSAAMVRYNFIGFQHEDVADVLDLNGQVVDGSHIEDLIVTGAQGGGGFLTMVHCIAYSLALFNGCMEDCSLYGSIISFADGGYIDLNNCKSIHGVITITIQAPTRGSIKNYTGNLTLTAQDGGAMFVRGFKGGLVIDAMTAGTLDISMDNGTVTINADCTGGTINIYGNAKVIDNSVGAVVTDNTLDERVANINDQTSGILVQVPFFASVETVQNDVVTIFQFDALGCTIRDILVSFYLPLHLTATFTPTWEKTRAGDLVTFTAEAIPALATIATPAANNVYRYHLGEIAQGLQGRFRLAQSDHAGVVTVDAFAVAVMEI